LSQKINSVKQAIIILGTDEIMNLAFGLGLSESFKEPGIGGTFEPKALWKHSVEAALVGRYLCREKKKLADEGIFAACILHDFGKLFLIKHFPDEYKKTIELARKKRLPLYDLEEAVFGYNHGGIGGMIAGKWNLPASLVQAISFHHHPSLAEKHAELAAITGFANYICSMDENNSTKEEKSPETPRFLKEHLVTLQSIFDDVTPDSIENTMADSRTFLNENNDIFSLFS
jgi:HD-like signal output (HDOD) protein